MTRKPTQPRAVRANDVAVPGDDGLHLPDDWRDDCANDAIAAEAASDEPATSGVGFSDDDQDEDDDADERARQMFSTLRSAPPKLVKSMLALDRAKNDNDIAAARAILRVSVF